MSLSPSFIIRSRTLTRLVLGLLVVVGLGPLQGAPDFAKEIEPLLIHYCYDCHGDGADKGDFVLDGFKDHSARTKDHESWNAVWQNLRSNIMPPPEKEQPTAEEAAIIKRWIEGSVFKVDPKNPDPGRVTMRRLNRREYQHAVKDLLGVDFQADEAFPPDDTGYGFDTIGDVLTISPLLTEKYLEAARTIAAKAVPRDRARTPEIDIKPRDFQRVHEGGDKGDATWLSFQWATETKYERLIEHSGEYKFDLRFHIAGAPEATENTGEIILTVDGKEVGRSKYGWDQRDKITFSKKVKLKKGKHTFRLLTEPKDPAEKNQNHIFAHGDAIRLTGPLDGSAKEYPREFERLFPNGPPNFDDFKDRRRVARDTLKRLAGNAFRRPVDDQTVDRLVGLYHLVDIEGEGLFEDGIAHAITAILCSPRFLFRAETQPSPDDPGKVIPLDEFALASRLSFFLWGSIPDGELLELAKQGKLRDQFSEQATRLLDDKRSWRFTTEFAGQWLQLDAAETIFLDARRWLGTRDRHVAYRTWNDELQRLIALETNLFFNHVLLGNRPATELLTADYTFLNDKLAKFYGIPGVEGREMRRVKLPQESKRGGLLTHASIHAITSNPTTSSPVKRGLFVLDNILGTPAPPAPPDIPELEEAREHAPKDATMAQLLALHAEKKLCASCHARFDPIGLAMETFTPISTYRVNGEDGKPIDTKGKLITGEEFDGIGGLQKVIATQRKSDFLRCCTEKLMTYALGRGLEYYDTPTVDRIVAELLAEKSGGTLRSLIHKVIWSHPFQHRRGDGSRLAEK